MSSKSHTSRSSNGRSQGSIRGSSRASRGRLPHRREGLSTHRARGPVDSGLADSSLLADLGAGIAGPDVSGFRPQKNESHAAAPASFENLSSEEDIKISLGIQTGIEKVWQAALEKVGSLSLAWNAADAQTRDDAAEVVDPSLVFDNMRRAATMPNAGLSIHKHTATHGSVLAAHEHAVADTPGSPQRSHASLSPRVFGSGSLDALVAQDVTSLSRQARSPLSCAQRIPSSKAGCVDSLSRSVEQPANVDSIMTRRRANSLPCKAIGDCQPALHNQMLDIVCQQERLATFREHSGRDCRSLSSLEDEVSGMFTELGLRSPYVDKAPLNTACLNAAPAGPNIDAGASRSPHIRYRQVETIPWFHQAQYIASHLHPTVLDRDLVLADDDSSCADNMAEFEHRRHRYSRASALSGGYGGGLASLANRRLTATSGLSTVDGSSASTAIDPSLHRTLFSPRSRYPLRTGGPTAVPFLASSSGAPGGGQQYSPLPCGSGDNCAAAAAAFLAAGECDACSDHKKPCCQMHSILARIEQTDQYVCNISRHASAVDVLLNDLRTQSRVLAETLSISQTRASALGRAVSHAIDGTQSPANDFVSESRSRRRGSNSNSHIPDYHLLSRKGRELHKRTLHGSKAPKHKVVVSDSDHDKSWSFEAQRDVHSRTGMLRRGSADTGDSASRKSHSVDRNLNTRVESPRGDRRAKHGDPLRQRRPEQPIAVRVMRINKQWAELCAAIDGLAKNSLSASPSTVDSQLKEDAASVIVADGLKLIQRVLKTTLTSLDKARAAVNMPQHTEKPVSEDGNK
ncbi:hypothetical protein GGI07_005051 [Coemansia sp. Benny D115]|nr:hypothetical protein GGI07_005051 [Coemansia sp. Benny D115]